MLPILTLLSLIPSLVFAVPCVQFDTNWDLYAFGGNEDVKLGNSSSWSQPSVTPLSTSGRPPWTGQYTQCLQSQYNNAMYVLGADDSDLSKIYIYNFAEDSWSLQDTSAEPSNLGMSRSASVLDHDTNVIFTLTSGSGASLYQLDLSTIQATAGSSQAWSAVENPSFSTSGYTPVAAEASNHIHYFGVPDTAAGSADLFVVHYAYFQPTPQSYPTLNGGEAFPDSGGQAINVPNEANNAPDQMVFFPNDFSNSYVVTHWTNPGSYNSTSGVPFATDLINTTQILPAPSSQDQQASYAASPTDLVQIDTAGNIYYMTNAISSSYTVQSGASWTKMSYQLVGSGGSGGNTTSSSSSTSMTGGSSSTTGTSGSSETSAGASGSKTSGAASSGTSKSSSSTSGAAGVSASLGRWDLAGVVMTFAAVGGVILL
ncbi:hypothetical protein BD324DRAFT_642541 [Kockovaella imperatae]|uniref:Uncharacterized protein n=1 Tax=Kockovaella imperatae TaxID=4999 RepID=A0A1Y1UEF5_9TREE|nr:hypothetical protein BD324DRAFT_642541 [Kockovaella imperatae]ORX36369.1 hypothetical protein BD324DRAFT_642541 [Kockovaella imperatae]